MPKARNVSWFSQNSLFPSGHQRLRLEIVIALEGDGSKSMIGYDLTTGAPTDVLLEKGISWARVGSEFAEWDEVFHDLLRIAQAHLSPF